MITTTMLTGLFRQPCGRCHITQTLGRCQECSAPLCLNCANQGKGKRLVCLDCHVLYVREQSWDEFQAIPSYARRWQRYHDSLAAFFRVISLIASEEVDPLSLNYEEANEWRELQDAWEQIGARS